MSNLQKQYVCKLRPLLRERAIEVIVSAEVVDRDGDIIKVAGINLENFRKNPVVHWSHRTTDPPIARAAWIKAVGNQLKAKAIFAKTEAADEIYDLIKGKFVNSVSIGFMSIASRLPTAAELKDYGNELKQIIDKSEMLEFSFVSLPSNTNAIIEAVKSKNLNLSPAMMGELGIEPGQIEVEEFLPDVVPIVPIIKVVDTVVDATKHIDYPASWTGSDISDYEVKILGKV